MLKLVFVVAFSAVSLICNFKFKKKKLHFHFVEHG